MPTIAENMSGGARLGNLDPYYGNVTLLLRMDGANASTTFTDTSPNPKAITAVGNAQISTSQSKYGGSSGYFDGTGDYLTVANSSDNAFGLGDFTIECWVNFSALPGSNLNMSIANTMTSISAATFTMWWIGINNNAGTNRLYLGRHGNGAVFAYVNWTPSLNTWYHIAATRSSGSVIGLFINGVSQSVATSGSNWANDFSATGILAIGEVATALQFNGYIDEFRLTKGVARYTTSFTPAIESAPIFQTYIITPSGGLRVGNLDSYYSNVSLSLHMDGSNTSTTFTDSSPNAFTVTPSGNAQISTAQSKYGGASASFDGTGDYLSLGGQSAFAFGTGDFTIEFWVYFNNLSATYLIYDSRPSGANGLYPTIYFDLAAARINYYQSTSIRITGTIATPAGDWHHVALCRSGTNTNLYINGVQSGSTYTDSNSYLVGASRPTIGGDGNAAGSNSLNGYIDDLRVTKFARYTSSFTPASESVPTYINFNITGSGGVSCPQLVYKNSLLMHLNAGDSTSYPASGTAWYDLSGNGKTGTLTNGPTYDNSTYKSIVFDGTNDYVAVGAIAGDFTAFTVTAWFNATTIANYRNIIDCNNNIYTSGNVGPRLEINSAGNLMWIIGGNTSNDAIYNTYTVISSGMSSNTWYSATIVRSSAGLISTYLNGSSIQTNVSNSNGFINAFNNVNLGVGYKNASDRFWIGKIADVQIYNRELSAAEVLRNYNTFSSTNFLNVTPAQTIFNITASGGLRVGGSSNQTFNDIVETSGGNKSGGSSANTVFYAIASSGGSLVGGSANQTFTDIVETSGGDKAGGSATANVVYVIAPSGGDKAGGSATANVVYAIMPSGGTTLAGSATATAIYAIMPSGGTTLGGSATATVVYTIVPSGGIKLDSYTSNDPYYNNVSAMFHFNGINNQTTFSDSSIYPVVLSRHGSPKLNTSTVKFGSSSVEFKSNAGSAVLFPTNSRFDVGSENWTVEFWYYYQGHHDDSARLFQTRDGDLFSGISLSFKSTSPDNTLVLAFSLDGSSWAYNTGDSSGITVTINDWTHVAIVRNGSDLSIYINGIKNTLWSNFTGSLYYNSGDTCVIGGQSVGTKRTVDGHVDEFKFTKGIAVYTSNFSVPTVETTYIPIDVNVVYEITPFGGVSSSGFANQTFNDIVETSGGALLSGSATPTVVYAITPSGGASLAGSSNQTFNDIIETSGGILIAGSATLNIVYAITNSGGTIISIDDSYFPNVSLLLHMDGADGSTTFIDSSLNAFTVTAVGSVQINATASKFGGASGYFNGVNSCLTLPINSAFGYGTGDFTWEMWFNFSSLSGNRILMDHGFSTGGPASGYIQYFNGILRYYNPTTGTSSSLYTTGFGSSFSTGVWYHIAASRQSGTTRLFTNGTLISSASDSRSYSSSRIVVGAGASPSNYFNGYIDDFRITKGFARYVENFTPPISAFGDSYTPNRINSIFNINGSGSSLIGASAISNVVHATTTSGGALINGSATPTVVYEIAPSNGALVSGTSDQTFNDIFETSGGTLISGNAVISTNYLVIVSGGVKLSAISDVNLILIPDSQGGCFVNGFSIVEIIPYFQIQGALLLGGEAALFVNYLIDSVASIKLSGSGDLFAVYVNESIAEFKIEGSASLFANYEIFTTTEVLTGGFSNPSLVGNFNPFVSVSINGDISQNISYNITPKNGVLINGTIESNAVYDVQTSGGISLGGKAYQSFSDILEVSGGVNCGGTKGLFTIVNIETLGGISVSGDLISQLFVSPIITGGVLVNGFSSQYIIYYFNTSGLEITVEGYSNERIKSVFFFRFSTTIFNIETGGTSQSSFGFSYKSSGSVQLSGNNNISYANLNYIPVRPKITIRGSAIVKEGQYDYIAQGSIRILSFNTYTIYVISGECKKDEFKCSINDEVSCSKAKLYESECHVANRIYKCKIGSKAILPAITDCRQKNLP